MRFVVDTSAIVCVLLGQPDASDCHEALLSGEPLISAATVVELGRVAMHRFGPAGVPQVRALIDDYGLSIVAFDQTQTDLALAGMLAYGKGRAAPPAVLNLGDLYSYALAKALDLPLLFKGDDFSQTDVRPALARA